TGGVPADPESEAVIALQQLGYKPAEAVKMARAATAAGDHAATIIRKALQSAPRCAHGPIRPRRTAMPLPRSARAHGGKAPASGRPGLAGLVLAAIGVVFGDIGTSPLYTLKMAFDPAFGLAADHDTVLGILSLVFWALVLVVTVKYVTIITRADNEGEGGIMALMALAQRTLAGRPRSSYLV